MRGGQEFVTGFRDSQQESAVGGGTREPARGKMFDGAKRVQGSERQRGGGTDTRAWGIFSPVGRYTSGIPQESQLPEPEMVLEAAKRL